METRVRLRHEEKSSIVWTRKTYEAPSGDSFEAVHIGYAELERNWSTNELLVALIASEAPPWAYAPGARHVFDGGGISVLGPRLEQG